MLTQSLEGEQLGCTVGLLNRSICLVFGVTEIVIIKILVN